jgi:RNA polymerase sigma-70 factor (ECF subfamily)
METFDPIFVRVLTGQRVQLMAFIWSIVRTPELVEDVYQDVCLVAMEKRPITSSDEDLMRWLRGVARNKAMQALERRQKHPKLMEPELLQLMEEQWRERDGSSPGPELEHLHECLNRLTPYSREIVNLRYGQGLATGKVADVLQRKADAVYKALVRIHVALEECVRRRLQAENRGSHV